MYKFMAPCPHCFEMFEDEDEFFIHVTGCEENEEDFYH